MSFFLESLNDSNSGNSTFLKSGTPSFSSKFQYLCEKAALIGSSLLSFIPATAHPLFERFPSPWKQTEKTAPIGTIFSNHFPSINSLKSPVSYCVKPQTPLIPIVINNGIFELRQSCRQIVDRKWHSINAIQCHLRSAIFGAFTRLNMPLFITIGITPEMRLWRVRQGRELIEKKLQNQFMRAQNQAALESDKAFQYLSAPEHFKGQSHTQEVSGLEVGVCHFIGRRPTMEDEHLATSFDLNIQGNVYPVQLFGIFDGHGGSAASLYVKQNLEKELQETLLEFCEKELSHENIWNALKIIFAKLNTKFQESQSGTTATVAMILDGNLWTANVGDSRTILDNGIQLSEDAKPSDPYYKKGIENRGGKVYFNRINGMLAVARAVGDHNVGAVNPRPKITAYPLNMIPKGSHLILTCDGIYDVSSTRQIAEAVQMHKEQTPEELARNIVYSAFQAHSGDNLSALIVKF